VIILDQDEKTSENSRPQDENTNSVKAVTGCFSSLVKNVRMYVLVVGHIKSVFC